MDGEKKSRIGEKCLVEGEHYWRTQPSGKGKYCIYCGIIKNGTGTLPKKEGLPIND